MINPFYLEYKNLDGNFVGLKNNTDLSLNGFLRNFSTSESIAGGSIFIDLRLYGTNTIDYVSEWSPTTTEKAPNSKNFARVSYSTNKDIKYVLLVFDFSESFLKNYTENLVYYDTQARTLLDSVSIKLSVGSANQETFNLNSAKISSDYISINGVDEKIGILFTDNTDVQQFLADNATISNIKYLIYNYIPKSINNINEYIPIRLELSIANEELNKLTTKQLGNEYPTNKIEEISQIIELQKQEFSKYSMYERHSLYLNKLNLPITRHNLSDSADSQGFTFSTYMHSLSFITAFSFNKFIKNNEIFYDFFKLGNYIFELKPEVLVKDALPKNVQLSPVWEGRESSVVYKDFNSFRSISDVMWEISAFLTHIIWLFNESNSVIAEKVILRKVYLEKAKNILLNLLFNKKPVDESYKTYYEREDIYRTSYKKLYNYVDYSGDELNKFEIFMIQMFARSGLYIVDLLKYLDNQQESNNTNEYENFRLYAYLEDHIFNSVYKYNKNYVSDANLFTPQEIENSILVSNGYLNIVKTLFFAKQYLYNYELRNFGKRTISLNKFFYFQTKIVNIINQNLEFIKIFNPNIVGQTNETFLDIPYSEYAFFLSSIDELLSICPSVDCFTYSNTISNKKTSNYQFWHIIEKDFALNSIVIGNNRLISLDNNPSILRIMLDNIDIISTMLYGYIDSTSLPYGSTLSLKTKITTNI